MSTAAIPPKRHRATRSAAMPHQNPSSQNPQNAHLLNMQAYTQNSDIESNYAVQPSTPPKTPRRVDHSQPTPQTVASATNGSVSKQRSRNKNRPKNVMTSPAMTKTGRNTPPTAGVQAAGIAASSKPISTPSSTAYAGATFHASPAPSALPIPSFYSKSVPDSPAFKGMKVLRGTSPQTTNSPPAAPLPISNDQLHREESPLDLFFKADREEKARARSASSNLNSGAIGPFPPPPESPSSTPQNQSRNRNSANGIFAMEMDSPGSPGQPFGPAFSTPYSERIKAARATSTPTRPQTNLFQATQQQATDRSEALKAYLFSGRALQSPIASVDQTESTSPNAQSGTMPQRPQGFGYSCVQDGKSMGSQGRGSGRSSGLRKEVTPTRTPTKTPERNNNPPTSPTPSRIPGNGNTPLSSDYINHFDSRNNSPVPNFPYGVASGARNADLQGMEDSLRKILKLDSMGSSGVTGAGNGAVVTASGSVPNYIGGRAPPMNGMHNGVMGS
ncbi:hypothetical protein BP5796_08500 [Coleophoma crateriformis]|uniref:Proteophosphoglycan 5 n=1 Tax=Coleophoma crateriformis TaxID=565419 RepID=A0A3D8R7S9_9HELO|nr:hypothetical protein BP5796_08500 [Coleophoma crateriformis]